MSDTRQQTDDDLENSDYQDVDLDEDESIIQPFDPELIRVKTRPMTIDSYSELIAAGASEATETHCKP